MYIMDAISNFIKICLLKGRADFRCSALNLFIELYIKLYYVCAADAALNFMIQLNLEY